MNDQSPFQEDQSQSIDRREARRQRREERLADPSRTGGWIAGIILILLGGMFLLRNTGSFDISVKNWWAIFILIPAVGSLDTAVRMYRNSGRRFTASARGSLLLGLVLLFITAMFLFDISWAFFGPILLILVGIGIIITYMAGDQE